MALDLDKQGQVPKVRVDRGPTLGWLNEPVNPAFINIADYFTSIPPTPGDNAGVSDCAPALNQALAAASLKTSAVIYFPPGTYKFLSAISYSLPSGTSSIAFFGAGIDVTTLTWPNAGGGIALSLSSAQQSFHLRDLTLTTSQAGGGTAFSATNSVSLGNFAGSDIDNLVLSGADRAGLTNFWTTGISLTTVSDVEIQNLTVFGNAAGNQCTGVALSGGAGFQIVPDILDSNFFSTNIGIDIGTGVQGLTVSNCNFTNGTTGIRTVGALTGLEQLSVVDSQFNVLGDGIVTTTAITMLTVEGCLFFCPPTHSGINLVSASFSVIANNNFQGFPPAGNGIGVTIGTSVANSTCIINGNNITNLATGLSLAAGSALVSVQGNVFTFNAAAISNSGSAMQIKNNFGYNPVGISAPITMGASPFTYTAGSSPESHYVRQSATNTATIAKGGQQVATLAGATTYYVIDLEPNESYVTTWVTTAPTYTKDIH